MTTRCLHRAASLPYLLSSPRPYPNSRLVNHNAPCRSAVRPRPNSSRLAPVRAPNLLRTSGPAECDFFKLNALSRPVPGSSSRPPTADAGWNLMNSYEAAAAWPIWPLLAGPRRLRCQRLPAFFAGAVQDGDDADGNGLAGDAAIGGALFHASRFSRGRRPRQPSPPDRLSAYCPDIPSRADRRRRRVAAVASKIRSSRSVVEGDHINLLRAPPPMGHLSLTSPIGGGVFDF